MIIVSTSVHSEHKDWEFYDHLFEDAGDFYGAFDELQDYLEKFDGVDTLEDWGFRNRVDSGGPIYIQVREMILNCFDDRLGRSGTFAINACDDMEVFVKYQEETEDEH